MATATNDTRFTDLKARLAALDCELLVEEGDHPERYVILDKTKGLIVSNGATIEDQYEYAGIIEKERGRPENAPLGLYRAAERVVSLTPVSPLAAESDGGYRPLPELAKALGDLENALDNADNADDDVLKLNLCDRTTGDEQRLIYAIQAIAKAADAEHTTGLTIALLHDADELAGRL
jgi:hypothetical protein